MAGSLSDFLELKLLDHVFGGGDYTRPTNVHIAAFTAAPTDSGGGTEVSGGSYARVQVTNNATNFPAASGGQKQNGTLIQFVVATASWGEVVAIGLFDAASSGNMLGWSWLGNDAGRVFTAIAAGDLITIPGHSLVVDDKVRFVAIPGSSLPGGISANTTYFVKTVSGNDITISATQGGATLDITGAGSGLIAKITPKQIDLNDRLEIAASQLTITLD